VEDAELAEALLEVFLLDSRKLKAASVMLLQLERLRCFKPGQHIKATYNNWETSKNALQTVRVVEFHKR